jgi:hypothetical protein
MGVVKLSTAGIRNYSKTSDFLSGNLPLSLNAFDLLETTTLSTSASSVTFSGLGAYSDYKHLQIQMVARADGSGSLQGLAAVLNSDTGSNYSFHRLSGNGTSVSANAGASIPYAVTGALTRSAAVAGAFGASVLDILDFSSTNKNTTLRSLSGATTGEGGFIVKLESSAWLNTSAVTSIQLKNDGGTNLVSGSRFSLYGVK